MVMKSMLAILGAVFVAGAAVGVYTTMKAGKKPKNADDLDFDFDGDADDGLPESDLPSVSDFDDCNRHVIVYITGAEDTDLNKTFVSAVCEHLQGQGCNVYAVGGDTPSSNLSGYANEEIVFVNEPVEGQLSADEWASLFAKDSKCRLVIIADAECVTTTDFFHKRMGLEAKTAALYGVRTVALALPKYDEMEGDWLLNVTVDGTTAGYTDMQAACQFLFDNIQGYLKADKYDIMTGVTKETCVLPDTRTSAMLVGQPRSGKTFIVDQQITACDGNYVVFCDAGLQYESRIAPVLEKAGYEIIKIASPDMCNDGFEAVAADDEDVLVGIISGKVEALHTTNKKCLVVVTGNAALYNATVKAIMGKRIPTFTTLIVDGCTARIDELLVCVLESKKCNMRVLLTQESYKRMQTVYGGNVTNEIVHAIPVHRYFGEEAWVYDEELLQGMREITE